MTKSKLLWFLSFILLYSCVTVNIYFPAQEAQKKAKAIVNEIRGNENNKNLPTQKPQSFNIYNIFVKNVYASDSALNITNAKIQVIKQSMKNRFELMKYYYKKGYLAEKSNGYLKIYRQPSSLKEKLKLKKLVAQENNDRKTLYIEVAKVLNIQQSQIHRLETIFAKQWYDTAPIGTYLQTNTGWIVKTK